MPAGARPVTRRAPGGPPRPGGGGRDLRRPPCRSAPGSRRPGRRPRRSPGSGGKAAPCRWISAVSVTGDGYLTVTVTTAAWPAWPSGSRPPGRCAAQRSAGRHRLTAPAAAGPGAPRRTGRRPGRRRGRRDAAAAGCALIRTRAKDRRRPRKRDAGQARPTGGGPAAAWPRSGLPPWRRRRGRRPLCAGRTSGPRAGAVSRQLRRRLDLVNPFCAVWYAHADAASVRRWAADLGLGRAGAPGSSGRRLLALRRRAAAPWRMSWLPERAAAAARRAARRARRVSRGPGRGPGWMPGTLPGAAVRRAGCAARTAAGDRRPGCGWPTRPRARRCGAALRLPRRRPAGAGCDQPADLGSCAESARLM